jgi:hypothetical protein
MRERGALIQNLFLSPVINLGAYKLILFPEEICGRENSY